MSMKNSNDTIGNQTSDLATCSAVPQSTAPPRTPKVKQSRYRPEVSRVFQEVKVPRLRDNVPGWW